jgi:hypothetical protein
MSTVDIVADLEHGGWRGAVATDGIIGTTVAHGTSVYGMFWPTGPTAWSARDIHHGRDRLHLRGDAPKNLHNRQIRTTPASQTL